MNHDPVFENVSALLIKVLGSIGPVTPDAKLVDDYDANSMDMVELADRENCSKTNSRSLFLPKTLRKYLPSQTLKLYQSEASGGACTPPLERN